MWQRKKFTLVYVADGSIGVGTEFGNGEIILTPHPCAA
jgi:hypothetical protein